ncbi:MAG: transposase, partial [Methanolinea sp. SDB]
AKQEKTEVKSALEEVIKEGARQMLQAAIETEVAGYIDSHTHLRDENGLRLVVRNGYMPERNLVTGIGPVQVRQPRVNDRRPAGRFTSRILPPFLRRVPSIDALIPCLYLKGISTGDFVEALEAILGPRAIGLSATNIVRLKEGWKQDYEGWRQRDLSDKHYAYIWVDGIHFNVRLEDDRTCILVIIGATEDGRKELVAVQDGYRESKVSWLDMLRDLKSRGLSELPAVGIGDGALGFWAAAAEEFPSMRRQRCWVHKTANILDKMPKRVQGAAKQRIHDMYMSETKEKALEAYNEFIRLYEAKYPAACACLEKDKDDLFTFYDFPAEHWIHLRTTNPIESTFSTVRLRTVRTKGCGSRIATLMMVYKLAEQAEKHWRRLNKHEYIALVIQGVQFNDGVMAKAS